MINSRQLINQLRVAYFFPTKKTLTTIRPAARVWVASQYYNRCTTDYYLYSESIRGTNGFSTPVVPYCGYIGWLYVDSPRDPQTLGRSNQSCYCYHSTDPRKPMDLNGVCIPDRKQIKSSQLEIQDWSSMFRNGYLNMFSNDLTPHDPQYEYNVGMSIIF